MVESFSTSKESLVPLLALNSKSNKNIIIFPSDKEAKEFATDFSNLNKNIFHLPSWDTLSYDSFVPTLDIQGKRLEIAHLLLTSSNYNISASIKAISQRIYFEELEICKIATNEEIDFDLLVENLIHLNYQRRDRVESKGSFAIRGGQLDVFPINYDLPLRVIFDGDLVNEIKTFDTISQRSISEINNILIVPANELFQIKHSDILNLSSNNKENLDDYELFQYSQNLDQEKCLLDLTSNPTLHIVDKNLVDNQLKETIDIEKDTFDNLKQYFSLEIRNFKSRYIDISKYLNDYDTNLYSTTDLMNLENLPNYFDSINTETVSYTHLTLPTKA